jgi:hypothetical protein
VKAGFALFLVNSQSLMLGFVFAKAVIRCHEYSHYCAERIYTAVKATLRERRAPQAWAVHYGLPDDAGQPDGHFLINAPMIGGRGYLEIAGLSEWYIKN